MSSEQPPSAPRNDPEKIDATSSSTPAAQQQDAAMDTAPDQPAVDTWADIPEDVLSLGTDEISTRVRLLENDIKVRHAQSV
jgi:26S proteasome regulatory subunit T5